MAFAAEPTARSIDVTIELVADAGQ